MHMKGQACFLLLDAQDELVPSSLPWSSYVSSSFWSIYIVLFVLVFYLCPSSIRVVTIFVGLLILAIQFITVYGGKCKRKYPATI